MTPMADGSCDVRFRLMDVSRARSSRVLFTRSAPRNCRLTAHKIADVDLREAHGRPRRVRHAHHLHHEARHALRAAGRRRRRLRRRRRYSRQTSRSSRPRGRPTARGSRTCRSSARNRSCTCSRSTIGAAERRGELSGSNSAPAWSPDGRRLAVVLTKDGGSQILT